MRLGIGIIFIILLAMTTLLYYYILSYTGPIQLIDGDSFWQNGRMIRLKDVDAPEHGQKGYTQATQMLNLLTYGENVYCSAEGRDKYNRVLARCYVGNVDLGAKLAKDCIVWGYGKYANANCKLPFTEPFKFRRAQKTAFTIPLLLDELVD